LPPQRELARAQQHTGNQIDVLREAIREDIARQVRIETERLRDSVASLLDEKLGPARQKLTSVRREVSVGQRDDDLFTSDT